MESLTRIATGAVFVALAVSGGSTLTLHELWADFLSALFWWGISGSVMFAVLARASWGLAERATRPATLEASPPAIAGRIVPRQPSSHRRAA